MNISRLVLGAALALPIVSCSSGPPASKAGTGGSGSRGGNTGFGDGGTAGDNGLGGAGGKHADGIAGRDGLGGIAGNDMGGTPANGGMGGIGGSPSTGGVSGTGGNGGAPAAGGGPALTLVPTVLSFEPTAVSDDGSVVIGRDADFGMGFHWTSATGTTVLDVSWLRAISADGTTLGGETFNPGHRVVRVIGATPTALPFPRARDNESRFVAMSRDGTTVAGNASYQLPDPGAYQAFRWTAADGVQALPVLPGDGSIEARAMSPDGTTIVGLSYTIATKNARPFRWTKDAGTLALPVLAGSSLTVPVAVNDAGVVIGEAYGGGAASFGDISGATSRDPIVWTEGAPRIVGGCGAVQSTMAAIANNGTILGACEHARLFLVSAIEDALPRYLTLPPAPDGYSESEQFVTPVGMSADGSFVIGRRNLLTPDRPGSSIAVWVDGMSPPTLLPLKWTSNAGEEVEYPFVTAVSSDAATIAGTASYNHNWVARLR